MARFVVGCIRNGEKVIKHDKSVNGIIYSLRQTLSNMRFRLYQKIEQGSTAVGYCVIADCEDIGLAEHYFSCAMVGDLSCFKGHDFVECKICGILLYNLGSSHLQNKHDISSEEYVERFPGARLVADGCRVNMAKAAIGRDNDWWVGKKHDSCAKDRMRTAKIGTTRSFEAKQKQSKAMKEKWADCNYRNRVVDGDRRSAQRNWENPEFASMMYESWQIKPNSAEKKLDEILQQNFPNEWKYTGDGGFVLEGLTPDFINVNGKKIAVELNGCYWHCCSECGFGETILPNGLTAEQVHFRDSDKKKIFSQYGFRLISIWEHDLGNIASVLEKLRI
jgi:G:T-mismatch repair DNA endonuclease (very short patch repair protein)